MTSRSDADLASVLHEPQLRACISGSGSMLPAAAYTSEDVLVWERRHFFDAGWVCVGRSDQLGAPGRRQAVRVGKEGILLVRGKDGLLRGFFNVCRHRGHELLPCDAQADGPFIRCPYHSWVFDLTGRLHGVPPSHEADVPDRNSFGLVPVLVAEWHGFVFVNASGTAPALEQYLLGLDDVVEGYDLANLRVGDSHEYQLATNWKLVGENYHECFHCDSIHPELCVVSDPDSGTHVVGSGQWLGGTMWLRDGAETMSLDGRSRGIVISTLDPARARDVVYLHLLPNLLLSLHPDYVMTHRLVPLAADRTFVQCQWLFPAQAWDRPDFDPAYAVDFWDLTNRQDWAACESVQRGVASDGFRPGPFSSSTEYVVASFVSMLARGYLAGGLPRPVAVPNTVVDASRS